MSRTTHEIEVVDYDAGWPAAFRAERRRLLGAMTGNLAAVHHIGSTAVAGLAAKPVIDLLVEVRDLDDLDARAPELLRLGYQAMGEYGLPGRRYFRRSVDGRRSHHVHAYVAGHPDLSRHLVFRDYLRCHPHVAQRYGALKGELATRFAQRRRAYAEAKRDVVERIERDALAWADASAHRPASIDTVLLDADGVVQRMPSDWLQSLAALCGDPTRTEEFLEAVFAAEKPCLTGQGSFAEGLKRVLERWNSAAGVDEALRVWTLIETEPAVLSLVQVLRRQGLYVALATNQQSYRARHMSVELAYAEHFDRLFYSCELGHAKPSPDYFAAVLGQLGTLPGQVLFVDDHAVNVQCAVDLGFSGARFHLDQGAGELARLISRHTGVMPSAGHGAP